MPESHLTALFNQTPVPPVGMVLPELANLIVTTLNFSVLFIVAVFFYRACKKHQTPLPLLFLMGGLCGYIFEPFFDVMVCVWYAEVGAKPLLRLFDVSVPAWVLAAWGFYMGGQAWWLYQRICQGISALTLWKLVPIFWLTNVAIEIPALQLGLYTYYGPQAFTVFGFPLWMGLANASTPILMAAGVYLLRDFLVGPRLPLVVVLAAMFAFIAESFVGWPMWLALHSGGSETITMIATVPVLLMEFLLISIVSHAICKKTQATTAKPVPVHAQA